MPKKSLDIKQCDVLAFNLTNTRIAHWLRPQRAFASMTGSDTCKVHNHLVLISPIVRSTLRTLHATVRDRGAGTLQQERPYALSPGHISLASAFADLT